MAQLNDAVLRKVYLTLKQRSGIGNTALGKACGLSRHQCERLRKRLTALYGDWSGWSEDEFLKKVHECWGVPSMVGATLNQPPTPLSTAPEQPLEPPTLEDDLRLAAEECEEKLHAAQEKKYQELLHRAAVENRVVELFKKSMLESLEAGELSITIPPAKPFLEVEEKTPESAVLVVSDSHVWKIVRQETTLNFGHYNPKIFLDRLFHLEQTVGRLLEQNIDNPIRKLHILFLGDLVEGMLEHAAEIPQRGYVADQVQLAAWAFYQFIARLSRRVAVECRGVWGNHARWPNQKKVPTDGRFSNFDFIVLGQIQQAIAVSKLGNTEFVLDEAPFQVFDIEGWRFKIGHGDHLKGGDKALGVPAHAIGREVNATTQRYAARGERVPDYYIVGDKHRHMSLSTATGRYMVNGAWFADDDYTMSANFMPNRPFQMLFGVHPRHGKSWSYDITLDKAPEVDIQYDLPKRLRDKVVNAS